MNRRYRKTVIAGNWKMNMTATETKKFAEELKKIMPRAKWCDTLICVPACNIQTAAKAFKDLRISVITTKRAYEELEREGFLTTVPGKGCFVAPQNPELVREDTLRRAEEHLSHAVDVAKAGGVTLAELTETLNLLYGDETL